MPKKAIIFDLDNTIYAVSTIADEVFAPLFELIERNSAHNNDLDAIKNDIMRRPFQIVARDFDFSDDLTSQGVDLLKEIEHSGRIVPFEDYQLARQLPITKFLVTTGFVKLQQSKLKGMKIIPDFKEIHIVDPLNGNKTKKDVFADILERFDYSPSDVLVVGDDLHSEIKAAWDLGIDAVLYDKLNLQPDTQGIKRIVNFRELVDLV